MSTRIPVSWLILLLLFGVLAFFGYHIIQASSSSQLQQPQVVETHFVQGASNKESPTYLQNIPTEDEGDREYADATQQRPPVGQPMPHVPGQTEEDLRMHEPLQAIPPSVQYDTPEAMDPFHQTVHNSAKFGSNLRHPEQMMEMRPSAGMDYVQASGLGSERSSPGGNQAVGYNPEFAQNGGEFMEGILAFDHSMEGSAYSML